MLLGGSFQRQFHYCTSTLLMNNQIYKNIKGENNKEMKLIVQIVAEEAT
jgi:hypothetical protein